MALWTCQGPASARHAFAVGDAYITASNLTTKKETHCETTLAMAVTLCHVVRTVSVLAGLETVQLQARVGVHRGPGEGDRGGCPGAGLEEEVVRELLESDSDVPRLTPLFSVYILSWC